MGVELLAGERPGLQVPRRRGLRLRRSSAARAKAGYRRAIKPHPLSIAVPGGFDRDDFVVDAKAGTATCPAGHTVSLYPAPGRRSLVLCAGAARYGSAAPNRPRAGCCACTLTTPSWLKSRRAWRDGDFAEGDRRWRPMVERSIAWLVVAATGAAASGASHNQPRRVAARRGHQPETPRLPRPYLQAGEVPLQLA